MRLMAVVAHQRARRALRVVILAAWKAVVDDQRHASLQALRDAAHPGARDEVDLADVRRRHLYALSSCKKLAARRAIGPGEAGGHASFHDGVPGPEHERHLNR